jgi:hypothetical protein
VISLALKIGNKICVERARDEEQLGSKNFPQIRNGFGAKIQGSFYELKSKKIH